jgi:adenosine deaminase
MTHFTKELFDQPTSAALTALRSIPKGDCHAHLVFSAPRAVYKALAPAHYQEPPPRFRDLADFLQYLRTTMFPILQGVENVRHILRACLEHMISDGITYTELSFDIGLLRCTGLTWKELVALTKIEIDKVHPKLTVWPELGVARDTPFPNWFEIVEEALATGFFKGIDLYGQEDFRPITDFVKFRDAARANGLRVKMHLAELPRSAEILRTEYDFWQPDAIQHGINLLVNESLVQELIDRKIPLHVCPWSNIYLRYAEDYKTHPIRILFDNGLPITIGSDDLGVFNRTVSEEYLHLYQNQIFSPTELESIRLQSLLVARASGPLPN